ncbi:hypothetical protein [Sorangium sp. So ce204]|uniref:hypothetical protein n=1 Tax=Sorangium sp. So ce204 TaxID=3133288 RepID=UPI003F5EAC2B
MKALETGLWSAEEAIDGLRRIDFVSRHVFVFHHLRLFPDASLRAVLALVRQPQPGDGAEWFPDEAALTAVAVRAVAVRLARAEGAPRRGAALMRAVEAIAAVMPLVPAVRAVELAGRVLETVAEGQIGRTQASHRLMAIPDPAWAALPASRWEPALRWALEEGAEFFDWTSWRQKTLPREVCALIEVHANASSPACEGEVEASPSAPEPDVGGAGGELSPEQRLRRWASEAALLSEAERAALAPEIDAAVRSVLAQPDTKDGVLCDTMASLLDAALRAIWSARARADAWRRTIDISDPALFAYLPSEHYLHAGAVLQLILRLGGASALCDFGRMLVGLRHESAA